MDGDAMTFLQIARWQLAANKRTAQCDRQSAFVAIALVSLVSLVVALTQIAPAWERVAMETQECCE
jgi:hypothetical protein